MKAPPAYRDWLKVRFGFEEQVYQGSAFQSAVQSRMRLAGLVDEQDYWQTLRASDAECQALAELLLVPESWFFRDRAPFLWLEQWLRDVWLPGPGAKGQVLRILSVPCATGQEPYSIAMTVMDAGMKEASFRLEAGDVSSRFIEQARTGVYRNLSFRGKDAEGREHHFEKLDAHTFKVRDEIRAQVHFQPMNLMDLSPLQARLPYQIIFCRNALIYFTKEARRQVLTSLLSLMDKKGLFFCGHADAVLSITDTLEPVGSAGAFSYRFRQAAPPRPSVPVKKEVLRKAPSRSKVVLDRQPDVAVPPVVPAGVEWQEIRVLADKGFLEEAEARCREGVTRFPAEAEGWFLLGTVQMARKFPEEAETLFKKAVYLQKDHAEALFQLALISERRGDTLAAERYRKRARKAGSLFITSRLQP